MSMAIGLYASLVYDPIDLLGLHVVQVKTRKIKEYKIAIKFTCNLISIL